MARGIYSSGMSCWERRKAGLAQDNAGPVTKEEKVEVVEEEKPVAKKAKSKKKGMFDK